MTQCAVVFFVIGTGAAAARAEQSTNGGSVSGARIAAAQQNNSATRQNISPADATVDWMNGVKKSVAAHNLADALQIVDGRLAAVPGDSDAMGWRAKLLAWMGRRAEAETEFQRALQLSPRDSDYLLGLATLLALLPPPLLAPPLLAPPDCKPEII